MIEEMLGFRIRVGQLGVAVSAVAVAALVRTLLGRYTEIPPSYLLFFGAVMTSAWFGGSFGGIAATVLSTLSLELILDNPSLKQLNFSSGETIGRLLFVGEGIFISLLAGQMHRARRRAETSEAETIELERKILEVGEIERRRLGQDLHDGLGQLLTGAAFLGKAIARQLRQRDDMLTDDAENMADLSNKAISWTRDLAHGLAPMGLDADGLADALDNLAESTTKVTGVKCEFEWDEAPVLVEQGTELHLYRVVQEAVTNAVKHSRAKTVRILLLQSGGSVSLSVEDDGVGISHPLPAGGIGLQIMRYRAKMIGGQFSVERGASGGTVVTVNLSRPAVVEKIS